ncbi:MAG: AAA family ATPase [Lachnospiraceae bacterium]|nr:AAA family ATPase [Lachnospiraceae bacterium]
MQAFSNQQLNHIASQNYRTLLRFCTVLEEEGYWEQAEQVLHLKSEKVLEIYVQSLLVCFSVYCRHFTAQEKEFIASLSEKNELAFTEEREDEKIALAAERFQNHPPILYQLLSLRDLEHGSGMAGLFFDGVLNIMLCLSYLDGKREAIATKYLGIYFDRISMFLQNSKHPGQAVDSKYIFKKLCNGELEKSNDEIVKADGNFELYKRRHLFYRSEQMESVQTATVKPMQPAEAQLLSEAEESREEEVQVQTKEQAVLDAVQSAHLDALVEELNALVGLKEVKTEIRSLINLIKVRKMREKYCLPEIEMSYHMVFTGNPGTGKTTLARLVGKIYKELGILTHGEMTETDRSGLVAGYVGQTALKVKEVVEKAIGGVLFIDEAYALASAGSNDFGGEAIDTLVKLMEDHRENLVVIVAGYTEEMKRFLKSNTGLMSRFNRFIPFPDYSTGELVEILAGMAKKAGLVLEEGLSDKITAYLEKMTEKERYEFGNARGIRNLFETMVVNQANRIVTMENCSVEQLTLIKGEDISWLEEKTQ